MTTATGAATTTAIRDMTPDACFFANRHGTAHVRQLGLPVEPNAEVGWYRGPNIGSFETEESHIFYNVRRPDGTTISGYYWTSRGPNTWSRYKVERIFGGTRWRFWWDWNADGTYDFQMPTDGNGVLANFWAGSPMGETARVGNSAAYDHHKELFYRDAVGTWFRFTAQAMERDEIPTDHWHRLTGSEYEVHPQNIQHPN